MFSAKSIGYFHRPKPPELRPGFCIENYVLSGGELYERNFQQDRRYLRFSALGRSGS
jgi:hypothetical protein